MKKGRVKWFNNPKGWGFILHGNNEYFFHYSRAIGDGYLKFETDDIVQFNLEETPKGTQAVDVERLSDSKT